MRHAVLLLALLQALPARSLDEASQAIARRLAQTLRRGESAGLVVRTTPHAKEEPATVRASLERAFKTLGVRLRLRPPIDVEAVVTISANARQQLLVAEFRRGEEKSVAIVEFDETPAVVRATPRLGLERKLLIEHERPILDAAVAGERVAVLESGRVVVAGSPGREFPDAPPAPRDPRGRLQVVDDNFTAWLPGRVCRGSITQSAVVCEPAGGDAALVAGRNYFDGKPPFFSVATMGDYSVIAGIDHRTSIYNSRLEPVAALEGWGSDVAAITSRCGRAVIATRASVDEDADALQAFEIAGGKATAVSDPLEFPGPITALWPATPGAVTAVVRNPSGSYAAYHVTLACGR